jgi:hypothetical protein
MPTPRYQRPRVRGSRTSKPDRIEKSSKLAEQARTRKFRERLDTLFKKSYELQDIAPEELMIGMTVKHGDEWYCYRSDNWQTMDVPHVSMIPLPSPYHADSSWVGYDNRWPWRFQDSKSSP